MKDPISDPQKKVDLLKELSPAMVIEKVNAGKKKKHTLPAKNPAIPTLVILLDSLSLICKYRSLSPR